MADRNKILRQRFSLLYPTFKNVFKKFKSVKRNNTLVNTKNNKEQHYPKSCVKHQVKLNRLAVLVMIIIIIGDELLLNFGAKFQR